MRKLLVAATALLAGTAAFGLALLSPVDIRNPRTESVVILPGESLGQVTDQLAGLGIIRSRRAFMLIARVRGDAERVQAGPYRLSSGRWAWQILDRLVRGDVWDTTLTVPEGLWLTEIAGLAGPLVAGAEDSFVKVAQDPGLPARLGLEAPGLEGYLFPSTYRVIPGADPAILIRQMVGTFQDIWDRDLAERARGAGLTQCEVVTLASIVEAEARLPAEQPRIAAVYLNRLKLGMPLQADPTVSYALGRRLRRTLFDDLANGSPYNTYRVSGLPPGPIGNPGLGALRAVLWPDPECDDLYFVARGDGTHLFGRSYREHLANRRQVQAESRLRASP